MAAPKVAPRTEAGLRREAGRYLPRVQRALVVFVQRLGRSVSQRELERALSSGNVSKVMELFSDKKLLEVAGPLSGILRDALVRMGRTAAREV